MNIDTDQNGEAQEILAALRQIQDSSELQAEATKSPETLLDRLKLSGVARHAVAFAITAAVVTPIATQTGTHLVQAKFWA